MRTIYKSLKRKSFLSYFFILLTATTIFFNASAQIQTGLINIQADQFLTGNTLCYTEKYSHSFKSKPQVITSLVNFDRNDILQQKSIDYQLEIKTVLRELSQTSVNFIMIAKRKLGVWNKVSFVYLAEDRSDIYSSVYKAQTVDISGCGKILGQQFLVPVSLNQNNQLLESKNLEVIIFLTGFDLSISEQYKEKAKFQINIQKLNHNYDSNHKLLQLSIAIGRSSPSEIYYVSFSYILAQKSNQNLQFFNKVELAQFSNQNLQKWKEVKHTLELFRGGQIYGLNKFVFGVGSTKNQLSIEFTDVSVKFGSKYSSLQLIEISYLVIRQKLQCNEKDQIIKYDEVAKKYQCIKCDSQKRYIPNKQKTACVCIQNHLIWKGKCFPIPQDSIFSQKQGTYVCKQKYQWIYYQKHDRVYCKAPPKNSYWNNQVQKFQCLPNYFIVNGQCLKPAQNQIFDEKTKLFVCIQGYLRVQNKCVKPHENQIWSADSKSFVCKQGTYRVGTLCLIPPKNMKYSNQKKNFICLEDCYQISQNNCEIIPKDRKWSVQLNKLICRDGLFFIESSQKCLPCPQLERYQEKIKKFICNDGFYRMGATGVCQKPKQNQIYDDLAQKFICGKGYYKIETNNICVKPYQNSHYSQISHNFICDDGYFLIKKNNGFICLKPSSNQYYNQQQKVFKCSEGYYIANSNDSSIRCIELPKNKRWSINQNKLICIQNYYELVDGLCYKAGQNEEYDSINKIFKCYQGYYKIGSYCRKLPLNCKYEIKTYSIKCFDGYYLAQNGYQCLKCSQNCLECESDKICKKCINGFQISSLNNQCKQICGDGLRFNLQCDDGNNKNGDGCSSECLIQNGWKCEGGSPLKPDTCYQEKKLLTTDIHQNYSNQLALVQHCNEPLQIKMVGLSHLYGKIVLNAKLAYIPQQLLQSQNDLKAIFKVLTNSKIALTVNAMYINKSTYTFVILYDFHNVEPIPEYLTRIQISSAIKQKYFKNTEIKPLFIKVNPALMAKQEGEDELN